MRRFNMASASSDSINSDDGGELGLRESLLRSRSPAVGGAEEARAELEADGHDDASIEALLPHKVFEVETSGAGRVVKSRKHLHKMRESASTAR